MFRCCSRHKAPVSSSQTRAKMRGAISSTVNLQTEFGRRSRGFKADQPAADHDQVACSLAAPLRARRASASVRRVMHVRHTERQMRQFPHQRSGCEHRAHRKGKRSAGFAGDHLARRAVDGGRRVPCAPNTTLCAAVPPGPAISACSGSALPVRTAFDSGGFS